MNVTRLLGLAAVGALLILAAPTERAQALSLASPGGAGAPAQQRRAGIPPKLGLPGAADVVVQIEGHTDSTSTP